MTNPDSESNFLRDLLQLLSQEGSGAFSQLLQVLLNKAMLLERSSVLEAKPYERTSARKGYANGFKPKTLHTPLGSLRLDIPQVRSDNFTMDSSLTRRRFLTNAGSLLALSSGLFSGGDTQAEPTVQTGGIIDTHVHFYDPTRPQGVPWPGKNDTLLCRPVLPNEFEELTRPHGVEGTLVVEASAWFEDNQWVLDLAAENPVILGLVGRIDPDQPEFSSQLEKLVGNPLFLGLRMKSPSVGPDLKRFSETGRVLDVIVRWEILPQILKLAEAYPTQKIVLEHFTVDFSENPEAAAEQHRLLKEAAQAPNIYAKISNVIRKRDNRLVSEPAAYSDSLEELWGLFGPNRVMFGSNWPVSDRIGPYPILLEVVRTFFVQKGQEACAKYFSKNSHHIYGWKARTDGQRVLVS